MPNTFYITTPIYYVNSNPHIGHSYTSIAADAVARYQRLKGKEVLFLTGSDEHGQKIVLASQNANLSAQEFIDKIVGNFIGLWDMLCVSYDDFIRTTQKRHIDVVQKALTILYENKDLYLDEYKGWYCVPCETFWPPHSLEDQKEPKKVCPDCKRPIEEIKEKNYFFRLSKYQGWLVEYIKTHPDFIKPPSRRNEVLSFLENPLMDLCISRPKERLSWGVPIPFSEEHVTYVWFDALLNYISGCGYLDKSEKFKKFWPADFHFIGKDILRPHAVYWPIMLHALELEPPKTIFAHGWWLVPSLDKDALGEKMSKSRGNIVDPVGIVKKYGQDAFRFFLLREISFGLDGSYSESSMVNRINSDLANDLGNLLNRTITMVEKYFSSVVPKSATPQNLDSALIEKALGLHKTFCTLMDELDFSASISAIWEVINHANKYIEEAKPWNMSKEKNIDRLSTFIYTLVEVLRIVTISISPFMPNASKNMWHQLGITTPFEKASLEDLSIWGKFPVGTKVERPTPLFPRIKL